MLAAGPAAASELFASLLLFRAGGITPDFPEAGDMRAKPMWVTMKVIAELTSGPTYNRKLAFLIPSCDDMIKAWIKR